MSLPDIAIIILASASIAACAGDDENEKPAMPKIVEVFACSDYCPGPKENYIKRVYDGVTDEEECRRLGGHPFIITGWGKRIVCEVR